MGGIFGFACNNNMNGSIIRDGLKRLLYRGHDGAGFALLDDKGSLIVRKAAGHLENVSGKLGFEAYASKVMVGHTRYASRGVPADFNSHPLTDCGGRVAVVSDGIIYGYEGLRESLRRSKHRFASTTDTEVLAHMMEELLARGVSVLEATLEIGRRVSGLYSAAFIVEGFEGLTLISRGQPIALGFKSDGSCIFVSSDIPSLYGFADEAMLLEDNAAALVSRGGYRVVSLETGFEVLELPRKRVKYPVEFVGKGGFPHYMIKEIYETPEALVRTTATLLDKYLRLAAMIIAGARNVIVIGNGSSLHAGLVAQYYFSEMAGLSVNVASAAEFPYYALNNVSTGTVIIAISQSGETSDVIRSVKLAKMRGAVIVGVVNVLGSRLTVHSNVYLPVGAGPEIAVPATKSLTSTLAALSILAGYTGLHTGRFSVGELSSLYEEVKSLAKDIKNSLERIESKAAETAERLSYWNSLYVTSSGINYPITLEGALKLKEAAMVHAEGVQLGELRHGPMVLVGEKYPVIVVEPVEEEAVELYEKVVGELEARGAPTVKIGFRAGGDIEVPKTTRTLAPIASVIPLQLIAYKLGSLKGLPIDTPPGLAKAVTT
ncbi:MAG: glutamine--fructose-6-phosphate transaminase (isomerizing) [Thermoprotei archaeon]|nr:glutamine--fructose-6-phosphate transaminase (isomerizing) [Thermoprotei archaeon]